MSSSGPVESESVFANFNSDAPAGLVVFLVALPLCLGIALASGAPAMSGLLAGICGGLIVPLISRSQLSVCGPAAGLTAIVSMGITDVGGFEIFLAAVVVGGAMQILMGLLRLGTVAVLFPSAVIKGMLAAIGLILLMKQLKYAIGFDAGIYNSLHAADASLLRHIHDAFRASQPSAFAICALGILLLVIWGGTRLKRIKWMPAALAVVIMGVVTNEVLLLVAPRWAVSAAHMVSLPISGAADFFKSLSLPNFHDAMTMSKTYTLGFTVALVASLETLLCVEAVDQLDPYHRRTPTNRELVAQGVANAVSGLIGGLPVTSVIVRSSANLTAGARTRMSAIIHGVLLLLAVMFLSAWLKRVPLACLAAVLFGVGFKLAHPRIFAESYRAGLDQFIPFISTVGAILATDLLRGIGVGIVIGVAFVLRSNMRASYDVEETEDATVIRLRKDVSFLNKLALARLFDKIPKGRTVIIDGSRAEFIDRDIKELIVKKQEAAKITDTHIAVRRIRLETVTGELPAVKRKDAKNGEPDTKADDFAPSANAAAKADDAEAKAKANDAAKAKSEDAGAKSDKTETADTAKAEASDEAEAEAAKDDEKSTLLES